MKKIYTFIILIGISLSLLNCGGSSFEYQKSPVDILIRDHAQEQNFSIILYDMDAEGSTYKHQYQLVTLKNNPDTVLTELTPWHNVSEYFFKQHINDMGMEIVSKVNGKVQKQTAPAGYNNYVGNEKYGRWTQRDGGSFWEFYGKYAMLSSVFNMMAYPVRRSYWNDYRSNYYGTGNAYYGPRNSSGYNMYGTRSSYNQSSNKNSRWNSKSSDFKNKVRSRVSRSSSSSYSSSKRSRSSSRYSGFSSRSRGGSFGK